MKPGTGRSLMLCAVTVALYFGGLLFLRSGDEMGYAFLNYYIIMPLCAVIVGMLMGFHDLPAKWIYPVFCGALGLIVPYIAFHTTDIPIMLMLTLAPAGVGLALGLLIRRARCARKK